MSQSFCSLVLCAGSVAERGEATGAASQQGANPGNDLLDNLSLDAEETMWRGAAAMTAVLF